MVTDDKQKNARRHIATFAKNGYIISGLSSCADMGCMGAIWVSGGSLIIKTSLILFPGHVSAWTDICTKSGVWENKMLSYRRETALQGAL